ncbi:MAG: N-acetylmuramoyl-L-alanine amidase, partial [Gemmatimonadota bacterium]
AVQRDIPVIERQGRRFVALAEIARLLGGEVTLADGERATLDVDGAQYIVHRRIPYLEHAGRWYQMTEPAQKDARGYFLPASSVRTLLPHLWPGRVAVPAGPGADAAASDAGVDVWTAPGRTRLDFRLAAAPGVTVDDGTPGTLRLHLADVSLPPDLARGLTAVGLVDSASVEREPGGTAVTLWLARAATIYAVSPIREPAGLEVVLLAAAPDEAGALLAPDVAMVEPDRSREDAAREARRVATPPPGAPELDAAPAQPGRVRPPGGWTIVLDAGHGGRDGGAQGPGGSAEKDVTLAVTRALATALAAADPALRVVLTRSDDTFIPLGERTRRANAERADLFISIHANSAERAGAEGFETYFLSAAKTEDARRVARMENAALRYETPSVARAPSGDVNFILWDLAQNEHLRASSALAASVQEELDRRLPLESRGVKQAGFFVLNGAFMPAILFEMAFISNPREEALLNDPAFRARLVDGLADSLLGYLDQYGRQTISPTAAR